MDAANKYILTRTVFLAAVPEKPLHADSVGIKIQATVPVSLFVRIHCILSSFLSRVVSSDSPELAHDVHVVYEIWNVVSRVTS